VVVWTYGVGVIVGRTLVRQVSLTNHDSRTTMHELRRTKILNLKPVCKMPKEFCLQLTLFQQDKIQEVGKMPFLLSFRQLSWEPMFLASFAF